MRQRFHLDLPNAVRSAKSAREWLESLQLPLSGSRHDDLAFLANELVTNVILHSSDSPDISVEVEVKPQAVRVEVCDRDGKGRVRSKEPRALATSGRGLLCVERLSDRWGWLQKGFTTVWFELDRGL
jgi:anti-sigma regulatory factor (Ser/Thr protein kinase)